MNSIENETRFYRGGQDHRVTTAENGGKVNADYLDFIKNGSWGDIKCQPVCDGVHIVTGLGFANSTFIETDNGWVLFDTGTNLGAGKELLKFKDSFSDKPVVAIIFSHHHYTAGAAAIREAYPDIPIYAHPLLEHNMRSYRSTGNLRGGQIQVGQYLPEEGEDARVTYGFRSPAFDDPELNSVGHESPTCSVGNGENICVDGLDIVFYHTCADATDSLIVHYPSYDMICHNAAVMPMLFPFYTLRPEPFRVPENLIAGIDLIRKINPYYLVGCHGFPVVGKEETYDMATNHRDAYSYLYQQTLRGIDRGLNPDQLVKEVKLPEYFLEIPYLFPAYVDVEYVVRGIYRGLVGWWNRDPADLHPPDPEEYHREILQGFGGSKKMFDAAQRAFAEKKYNLAAKLISSVLTVFPEDERARQFMADTLRKMAQSTQTGIQTRNFLLTNVLHLEGKIDMNKPPSNNSLPPANADTVLKTTPGTFIKLLENNIDPYPVHDLIATLKFTFTDIDQSFGIAIRKGAAEFIEKPNEYQIHLEMPRTIWAKIVVGVLTIKQAIDTDDAKLIGDYTIWQKLHSAFESVWGN